MIMIAALWLFLIIPVAVFIGWQLGAAIAIYKWRSVAVEERAKVIMLQRMLHLDPTTTLLTHDDDVCQASKELRKEKR